MTKVRMSVFTPWASVLCAECHNKHGFEWNGKTMRLDPEMVTEDDSDPQPIVICDDCGEPALTYREDVAVAQEIALAVCCPLEQTGGMCVAAVERLGDETAIWGHYGESDDEPYGVAIETPMDEWQQLYLGDDLDEVVRVWAEAREKYGKRGMRDAIVHTLDVESVYDYEVLSDTEIVIRNLKSSGCLLYAFSDDGIEYHKIEDGIVAGDVTVRFEYQKQGE